MQSSYVFLLLIVVIIIIAIVVLYLNEFTDVFGKKYKLNKDEKNILQGATAVQTGLKSKSYNNYDFNTSNLTNEYIKVVGSIDSVSNKYNELETKVTSTSNLTAGLDGFDINAHKSMYAVLEQAYGGASNVDTSLTRMLDAYKIEYDNSANIYNYVIGCNVEGRQIKMQNDVIINSDLKICDKETTPNCYTFSIDSSKDLLINYEVGGNVTSNLVIKQTDFSKDSMKNRKLLPSSYTEPFVNQSYLKSDYMSVTKEGFSNYSTVNDLVDKKIAEKSNQWAIGYGNISSKSKEVQKSIFNSAKGNNSIILTYKQLDDNEVKDGTIKYIQVKDNKYSIYPFYRYIQPVFKKTVDGNVKHYIKYNTEEKDIIEYSGTVETINITQNMYMPIEITETLKGDGVEIIYVKHE